MYKNRIVVSRNYSKKMHCPTCTAFRGSVEPPVAPRARRQTRQKSLSFSSRVTYGDAIGLGYPTHLRAVR